nr:hypothetical protein [uncultured Roseovarius sp.]
MPDLLSLLVKWASRVFPASGKAEKAASVLGCRYFAPDLQRRADATAFWSQGVAQYPRSSFAWWENLQIADFQGSTSYL